MKDGHPQEPGRRLNRLRGRGKAAAGAVGSDGIVLAPPLLDQHGPSLTLHLVSFPGVTSGEKAASVKTGVKRAIEYWERDPNEVELSPGAPMTPREWIREGILTGLGAMRGDGEKIFSMTFDDDITIKDG